MQEKLGKVGKLLCALQLIVLEKEQTLFRVADGSLIWQAKDFLIKQRGVGDVEMGGLTFASEAEQYETRTNAG